MTKNITDNEDNEDNVAGEVEQTTPVAVAPKTAVSNKVKKKVKKPADAAKLKPAVDKMEALKTMRSAMLQQTIAAARKEFGDRNICAASDADRIIIGLPLPCLALEYLIQNDVWPLGRFTQIVGKHGSCKSALAFEMLRWFKESAGLGYLFENETKYASDLATSIFGYAHEPGSEAIAMLTCHSVDDWQAKVQHVIKESKKQMAGKVGRTFPVLLVVDSLMGKLSAESQANIEKKGFADRAHPHEALMINSFLKKVPQDLEEWPLCLVCTNHLKPKKAENGQHMERGIPGGASPGFQETFEIELRRDASAKVSLVDEDHFEIGGLKLVLICQKNSLGETGRSINAQIRWWQEFCPERGEEVQRTAWDWPASTVDLLTKFEGHRADKIAEIVHIGGNGNKFYSRTFGISSTDPISKHDLGVLIEGDPEIKTALRKLFGIKIRKTFEPGVDYLKQLASLIKKAERNLVT